jgi:16S rRNA (cytidine1402-2'-O)-methyltransferase
VLAEDTRRTRKLLSHYSINVPLQSYHQHNKLIRLDSIIGALSTGDVALVSDAGTPAVADPGFELIRAVREAGMTVEVLPGPSAIITAVVAAALPAPGFLFVGFLPRRGADRRRLLERLSSLRYTLVAYESPHRLLAALRDLDTVFGTRTVAVARELTKMHEEVVTGTAAELMERFGQEEPRGEVTLLVEAEPEQETASAAEAFEDLKRRARAGEDRRSAVQATMNTYRIPRNEAYRLWLQADEAVSGP